MPTGYTAKILEGADFKQFAMGCARAFGACVEMRDEPGDAPIPEEFKPSNYHTEAYENALKEYHRLSSMTGAARLSFGEAAKARSIKSTQDYIDKEKAETEKYLAIRCEVEKWMPPTPEHVGLKEFMLQQIDVSISKGDYFERSLREEIEKPALDYFRNALDAAKRGIKYHTEEQANEIQRQADRTKWIKDLRESLAKL